MNLKQAGEMLKNKLFSKGLKNREIELEYYKFIKMNEGMSVTFYERWIDWKVKCILEAKGL